MERNVTLTRRNERIIDRENAFVRLARFLACFAKEAALKIIASTLGSYQRVF